jgi:hypothetical protein
MLSVQRDVGTHASCVCESKLVTETITNLESSPASNKEGTTEHEDDRYGTVFSGRRLTCQLKTQCFI